jgi:hypothetical protein
MRKRGCIVRRLCEYRDMTTNQLNQVAALLSANGITPTKEVVYSVCITFHIGLGMTPSQAFEAVMGSRSFQKLADEVFESLSIAA